MIQEGSVERTSSSSWLWLVVPVIVAAAAWRAVWLNAVLPDTTAQADQVRRLVSTNRGEVLVHFDGTDGNPWKMQKVEVWDPQQPVWVVSGADQKPGWAGWDDNGDGQIDDLQELGAAWSDDYCSIDSSESEDHPRRIIDRGAYVHFEEEHQPTETARYRFHFGR